MLRTGLRLWCAVFSTVRYASTIFGISMIRSSSRREPNAALLVDIVVSGFDVGEDAKLFDLLHVVDRKMDDRLKKQLDTFQSRFSEALEKKSGEVRKRILNRLKKMGITGSCPGAESGCLG